MVWQIRQYAQVHSPITQTLIASIAGIAIGLMAIVVSPPLALVALIGIGLLIAAIRWPGLFLVGILFFSSGIIGEDSIPVFEVGPGVIYLTDLMLVLLFGLIVVRLLSERDYRIVRTPLDLPLLTFLGITFLTGGIAIGLNGLPIGFAITELRIVLYYATLFTVTNLLTDRRQIMVLFWGMVALAMFVSAAMLLQFVVGQSTQILPGRVEALVTAGSVYSDITRIVTPGESLALLMCITLIVMLVLEGVSARGVVCAMQAAIASLAVVATFNRNFWIGVGLALLILAYLARGRDRLRLIAWATISTALLIILLLLVFAMPESRAQSLITSSVQRLTSLTDPNNYNSEQSTLRWRNFEYQYSIPAVVHNPLTGLGMGAAYRPMLYGIDDTIFDGRAYTHNAHMWILMKTGVFGYLAFIWLSLTYLVRGFRYWRSPSDPKHRGIVLGFTLTYIGVLVGSIVNPMLMQWYWTPVIGIMMGTSEAIIRWSPVHKEGGLQNA